MYNIQMGLEAIDTIASELFMIEESAMLKYGIVMPGDQMLMEMKFPTVSALLEAF